MNNRINKYQEFGRLRGKHWMAQIDEMVWALTNGSKKVPFKREDFTYLYDAEEIVNIYPYRDVCTDINKEPIDDA